MGRGGFSSGGRGGGGGGKVGGGGGGSRPSSRSRSSHGAEGDTLMRRAAACNGFRSFWDRVVYGPDTYHEDLCKSLVKTFELCIAETGGNRDYYWCQHDKRALEENCAEFKSSWNDWWAIEKKRFCDLTLSRYKTCWERHTKESGVCQSQREYLKKMCDIDAQ